MHSVIKHIQFQRLMAWLCSAVHRGPVAFIAFLVAIVTIGGLAGCAGYTGAKTSTGQTGVRKRRNGQDCDTELYGDKYRHRSSKHGPDINYRSGLYSGFGRYPGFARSGTKRNHPDSVRAAIVRWRYRQFCDGQQRIEFTVFSCTNGLGGATGFGERTGRSEFRQRGYGEQRVCIN